MKKIIALGDIHGCNIWEGIVEKENPDLLIFIGDYFDSRDGIPAIDQIHNFRNICRLKSQMGDRLIMLIGNHDFHYMRGIKEHYSGYQELKALDIQEALQEAVSLQQLQMAYRFRDIIFTHAGMTKTWCNRVLGSDDPENPHFIRMINDQFRYQPNIFRFSPGDKCDMYGNEPEQSPIWVRPQALIADKIDIPMQVVGHTMQDAIVESNGVFFIDTLRTSGQYFMIDETESLRFNPDIEI